MKMTFEQGLAESHKRQHNGEDYQPVANDVGEKIGLNPDNPEDESDYHKLQGSPDPSCTCDFCVTVDWDE